MTRSEQSLSPQRSKAAHRPFSAASEPSSEDRWVGAGLCVLASTGFASTAILGKFAFNAGFSLTGLLSLRFTLAALLLGFTLVIGRRRPLFPGTRQAAILTAIGGFWYVGSSTLYFNAIQRAPVSFVAMLFFIYPAFVALADWGLNHKRLTRSEWAALALTAGGVLLIFGPEGLKARGPGTPFNRLGMAMAIGSAVMYAGYIVSSDRFTRHASPIVSTAWIIGGAAIVLTLAAWATDGWQMDLAPSAPWILLVMAVFSTVFPLWTFLAGMARVGPTVASLINTAEPVFTVILAAIVLKEALTSHQIAGGGLVLLAVLLLSLPTRKPIPR